MSDLSAFKTSQPPTLKKPKAVSGNDFYIKAISGEYKGKVFKLTSNEIYIGRDKTNHIPISLDIKVSRRHARFIKSKGKLFIQDISSNNFIKINNEIKKESVLKNGAIVSVGEQNFKIIFDLKNQSSADNSNSTKSSGLTKKNKNIALAGGLALVGLLLLSKFTQKEVKNKSLNMRDIATSETLNERISQKTKELEKIEEDLTASEKSDPDYKSANILYLRGFREFQKGIYTSSMSSFEAALALYPEHRLARRYKNISENRLDELIDLQITQGRVYLDNGQYDYCIGAYKNALSSSYNKEDKRFIEAKVGLSRCETLRRSKY